jgi:hypothetical protein
MTSLPEFVSQRIAYNLCYTNGNAVHDTRLFNAQLVTPWPEYIYNFIQSINKWFNYINTKPFMMLSM